MDIVYGTAAGVNTDISDGLLLIQCPFLCVKHTSLPDLSPPSSCAPCILFICFARKQPQDEREAFELLCKDEKGTFLVLCIF